MYTILVVDDEKDIVSCVAYSGLSPSVSSKFSKVPTTSPFPLTVTVR